MAGERKRGTKQQAKSRALSLITEAMDLVDAYDISPEASAHLALAQQEIRWARDS